ncbi:MAG: hypothetical protein N2511_05980 [Thermodesulfovibrionales bacterium]|nr:hypothetical protein [Thermodesulfovibrionales bacterium]
MEIKIDYRKMRFVGLLILHLLIILTAEGFPLEKSYSDLDSQVEVEVTIYNNPIGLIKDKRDIMLKRGLQELLFMDVAAQIIPNSVSIKSLSHNNTNLNLLEQNFEYDLISPQRLLGKFVGREVKLYTKNPFSDKEEIVSAKILSYNEGVPVFQIGGEITFGHPGRIIFPELPESLFSKPTLIWLIDSQLEGIHRLEARYLVKGINWNANYVLVLNEEGDNADLSGWVTIDNRSGATFKNARLKLIAGEIHLVDESKQRDQLLATVALKAEAKTSFTEREFFEYHIFTLDRPTNIRDNQTKQIKLLSTDGVRIKKEYILFGSQSYYLSKHSNMPSKQKISLFVEFLNDKENKLGIPLPKGNMKVYKYDYEKSLQFIGENSIDHTPEGEKIRIKLGDVFDVVASKKQLDWIKITDNVYEVAFEISIKNHKREDITVKVIEPLPGDWRILQSSHEFKKLDANTISTDMFVGRGREIKLTYRVSLKF